MKKLFLLLFLFISLFSFSLVSGACSYDPDSKSVGENLETCFEKSSIVPSDDATVKAGLQESINAWTGALATFLGVLAVGSIVYGALLMTLSTGDDEKVKKAKDVIKWGMIGFVCVISASALIILVVNIMFNLS